MGDLIVQAAGNGRATGFDVVLRPRRSLVRSTVLSVAFSAVPLVVALVWVSLPMRLWPIVTGAVIAMAVAVGVVFVRLGTAYVGLDQQDVTVRGVVTPNRRIARDRVHRVVLATTHNGSVDRTVRELVAFDVDGAHLFRLRSDVWGNAGLDRLVDRLGVQVVEEARAMSAREFVRRYPASRAWYEQRGTFLVVGGLAVLIVGGLLVLETVTLFG